MIRKKKKKRCEDLISNDLVTIQNGWSEKVFGNALEPRLERNKGKMLEEWFMW
jgi:hypothetical protein